MRDGDGFVWIGVHFGSRGLDHASAPRYLHRIGPVLSIALFTSGDINGLCA